MKTFLLLIFSSLVFSSPILAEGQYDGIWNIENLGYASIHQNGEQLIFILLDSEADEEDGDYEWEAYLGGLNGNKTTQTTLISGVLAEIELTFESTDTVKGELKSCTPQTGDCDTEFSVGATFQGKKIW